MRLRHVVTVVLLLAGAGASAQMLSPFPPSAEARESQLLSPVGPQTRSWIAQEARREAALPEPSERTAVAAFRGYVAPSSLRDGDIEALAFLVLMEAAKSAQDDLKSIMDGVERVNSAKAAQREALASAKGAIVTGRSFDEPSGAATRRGLTLNRAAIQPRPLPSVEFESKLEASRGNADSLSEMGEMESLRLQMAMDRQSKMMETLSNILKKMSDTAAGITQSLK